MAGRRHDLVRRRRGRRRVERRQFAGGRNHRDREHVALRVVAFSFFGLAAVVGVEATRSLLGAAEAQPSPEQLAGLLAAETRCCPFLTFTLTIGPGGDRLDVRAPAQAYDIVTALVGAPDRPGGARR
ncbi:MAG: hypothetical protein ACFCVG_15485 [Kineosporiaceae bacterium]